MTRIMELAEALTQELEQEIDAGGHSLSLERKLAAFRDVLLEQREAVADTCMADAVFYKDESLRSEMRDIIELCPQPRLF